jgi:hypothetical protein
MAVKTKSLRRSKPNYIYSIVGVALVLLILGIMGWLFLNLAQAGNAFKEDIRISAYLRTRNKDSVAQIQQYIASQPYAKNVEYVDKEKAKDIWNKDNNEDWNKILDFNPLPESIDFYARAAYVNKDSLDKISANIMSLYGNQITDLQYPSSLVNNLNERASKLGLIFLVVAIVLCIIVIVSIDTYDPFGNVQQQVPYQDHADGWCDARFYLPPHGFQGCCKWYHQRWHCNSNFIHPDRMGRKPVPSVEGNTQQYPHSYFIWRAVANWSKHFGFQYAPQCNKVSEDEAG